MPEARTHFRKPTLAGTAGVITLTGAKTITEEEHGNCIMKLGAAAGFAVTLPTPKGNGTKYTFIVTTTVTSSAVTIKVPSASETMTGVAILGQDAADTAVLFETAGTTDTISLNGSTTGGILGDCIELIDIATNLYYVRVIGSATGVEATPFSATV